MPDEPNATLLDSEPFISKEKITRKSPDDGNKKGVEIAGLLNYLSNFLRTLEKELVDCETNHISKWPSTCIISNSSVARTFAITDTKTLCSSCNFINSRQCKTITTVVMRFHKKN